VSYFMAGNQKDGRLGPAAAPTGLATLVTLAEPLLFKSVVLSNTTAGPLTYTAHVVGVGGTAGAATQVVPGVTIPSNDTLTYEFGKDGVPMIANETIQHIASGGGLNVTAVFSRSNR